MFKDWSFRNSSDSIFSPDNSLVVFPRTGVWDAQTRRLLWRLPETEYSLRFTSDGSRLLSENRIFDSRTGKEYPKMPGKILWIDQAGHLAILQDTDVVVWDVDQGKAIRTISLTDLAYPSTADELNLLDSKPSGADMIKIARHEFHACSGSEPF
jgi:hypothetical protein